MRRIATAILTLVLIAGVGPAAAAQDQTEPTPTTVTAPTNVPADVLAGYIIPLAPEIRPLVATINRPDIGLRETTGGEETVITLDTDVFFDFDSDVVKPEAQATLVDLAGQLAQLDQIRVIGHTDAIGGDDFNLDLSRRRANNVAAKLAELVPALNISTEGRGESEPVAPNETAEGEDFPEGRALNRRVEIRYTA